MKNLHTPWGYADQIEQIAPGIKRVYTPSHGGFKVEKEQLAQIPFVWRNASFNQQGLQGWFEEDCDWSMVVLSFQSLFDTETVDAAHEAFDYWMAPKLAA